MLTHLLKTNRMTIGIFTILALTGCGGGGGDASEESNSISPVDGSTGAVPPLVLDDALLPPGDITQYGVVNVADDDGIAADVVASFFDFGDGISSELISGLFTGDQSSCEVGETPEPGIFALSAVFLPEVTSVFSLISVGDSLTLNSSTGQFALLELTDIGEFTFYSLPVNESFPDGPVPEDLTVNIPADSEEFEGVFEFSPVEPLQNFSVTDVPGPVSSEAIFSNTVFTWEASELPMQWVRIETQTAGGFFLDESISVSCLVPDTGFFSFPASVQQQLGGDFEGAPALVSRLSIETTTRDTSALFLIRESFNE